MSATLQTAEVVSFDADLLAGTADAVRAAGSALLG
ncbi:3'(2'),5'-bisphosphate nucleotidase CysQ, partial [Streptomyces sp. A1136]